MASKKEEREAREARERLKAFNARRAVHTHQTKRRFRDNLIAAIAAVVITVGAAGVQYVYFSSGPGAPEPLPSASTPPVAEDGNVGPVPDMALSEFRTWTGELTINGIVLGFELDGALAPQATAVFVNDARGGYYPGKTCHRLVISEGAGLLQCGSETGDGTSTPGTFSYGPLENVPADGIYPTGTLAIARTGSAYGNGHQFFIVFDDSYLPGDQFGGYTVVGKITSGLDELVAGVVDAGIEGGVTDGPPVVPSAIFNVTVQ